MKLMEWVIGIYFLLHSLAHLSARRCARCPPDYLLGPSARSCSIRVARCFSWLSLLEILFSYGFGLLP